MITFGLIDSGVSSEISRLLRDLENPQQGLKAIGELVIEFTKTRFEVSQDPYGVPWALNKESTIRAFLGPLSGKNYTRKGDLSARGQRVSSSKKPLIGESKSLKKQFRWQVEGKTVEIRSTMVYAAMQQFGGKKADFPHLWGDIPPRPFFPSVSKGLPPALSDRIVTVLEEAILGNSW